jgi:hypothetical protein
MAAGMLGDFQNTMANAVGFAAEARRFVGISVPLVGSPSDGGNTNGWYLPIQPRAMIYDIIFLSMTAPARLSWSCGQPRTETSAAPRSLPCLDWSQAIRQSRRRSMYPPVAPSASNA